MLKTNFLRLLKKQSDDIQVKQRTFVSSLEGLGDILVYETSKKANKVSVVKDGLRRIDDLIDKLFTKQETDNDRFERLVLSGDFFTIQKKSKMEANWKLRVDPERYLPSFSVPISQIVRIFDKAMEVGNEEISRNAVYSLTFALVRVTQNPGNEFFARQLLRIFYKVMVRAVEAKSSASVATISDWYPDIIFSDLKQNKKKLQQEYLPLLNEYLFTVIKYLIDNNLKTEYQHLIGYLVDGIHVFDESNEVWDYAHLLLHQDSQKYIQLDSGKEIQTLINKLISSSKEIDEDDDIKQWKQTFQELKTIIYKHLNQVNKKEANKIEKKLISFVNKRYRFNLLWEVLFSASAYSIFKNQSYFIRELWTHKQPDDASASHGGADLYPTSLEEVVKYYFGRDTIGDRLEFWEGHHGAEKYKNMYVLLLLMKYLEPLKPLIVLGEEEKNQNRYIEIEQFDLPFNTVDELSGIKYRAEQLIGTTGIFTQDTRLILELGISKQPDIILNEKLIPFLKHLITNAEGKLEQLKVTKQLSQTKIINFIKGFVEDFNKSAVIRNVLKDKGLYDSQVTTSYSGELQTFGINKLEPREMFFDDWHVDYSSYAEHFADGMASSEDREIFNRIFNKSTKITLSELENKLTSGDDYLMFVNSRFAFNKLEGSEKFLPKWYPDAKQLDMPGFLGWYKTNDKEYPVFEVLGEDISIVLAISVNQFGKLIQHSPLKSDEPSDMLVDVFRVKIEDLATTDTAKNELLSKPPEWLKKKGNTDEQKRFLIAHVILQIGERFDVELDESFQGFYSSSSE